MRAENVVGQEQLLNDLDWRIRGRAGAAGRLYLCVCTDEDDGHVLRLEPAN